MYYVKWSIRCCVLYCVKWPVLYQVYSVKWPIFCKVTSTVYSALYWECVLYCVEWNALCKVACAV